MTNKIQMLPRKPYVEFTPELKELYLEFYSQTLQKYNSAKRVGISDRTLDDHILRDPEFAARVREVKRLYVEQNMVEPARKMAFEGVEEPIIGGKERDQIVAYKCVIPTNLTMAFLKRDDPTFREGSERIDDNTSKGGDQGMVKGFAGPGKVLDPDDWKRRYQNAAKGLNADGNPYES